MKLGVKAQYAVIAMVDMANQEKETAMPTSLGTIAERQNLPLPYLEQLFARLRKAGLVSSMRGASGGYTLAVSAQDIRILDIIQAVDEAVRATRCDGHNKVGCMTKGAKCLTHDLWDELGMVMKNFLKQVTLADVCTNRIAFKR